MKKINTLILLASFAGVTLMAADPSAPQNQTEPPATPPPVEAAAPAAAPAVVPKAEATAPAGATSAVANGGNELKMNFRNASLDTVLDYMSEAAGFIVVREARPRGTVDIVSTQPVTKEEAVDLLNSSLNHNGYAAIRKGRTLTIVNKDEAKTKSLPVRFGGDPDNIPDNDEMVTQIIPVRFVEVGQLMKDVQPLLPAATVMTANESGNSLVITDTQSNIRKVAQVIKNIDMGAEDVTVVKVFHLSHADPGETADLLTNLFPDDSRSGSSQAPMTFGGFGGIRRLFGGGGGGPGGGPGGFGGPPGAGGGNSNGQNQRIRKRNRVVAVADQRTSSIVITATRDMMEQISNVIAELDPDPANQKQVAVFRLENAEPQDAMTVLQDIFQKSGTQNNRNTQNQATDALRTRSTQQIQQNSSSTASRGGNQGGRGGGFGQ